MELQKAPIREDFPEIVIPPLREVSGAAGWRLYTMPDPTVPLVVVRLLFPVGSAHAPQPGLARLTMRGILRGSRHRSAEQFHRQLERYGAIVDVGVTKEISWLSCTCLSSVVEEVRELVVEMVAEAELSEEEIRREQQRQRAALLEWCQEPESLASYALLSAIAPQHPYRYPELGTLPTLLSLTAQDCHRWYGILQRTAPRLLLFGGALSEAMIDRWLHRLCPAFPTEIVQAPTIPPFPQEWERKVVLIAKPNAVQSTVVMALPAPSLGDQDYAAAYLVTTLLGGYFLSRLNRRLREHEGLTYGVGASLVATRTGGLLLISGSFDTARVGHACALIIQEIERLRDELLPLEEVQRVVRVISGGLLRQMVTLKGVLGFYAPYLAAGFSADFPSVLFARLRSLGPEALLPVQHRLCRLEHLAIAASGPVEALLPQMASLGPVEQIEPPCADQEEGVV